MKKAVWYPIKSALQMFGFLLLAMLFRSLVDHFGGLAVTKVLGGAVIIATMCGALWFAHWAGKKEDERDGSR